MREAIHIVVVRGSGRICLELRLSRWALWLAVLQVLWIVPTLTGAVLSGHRVIAAALTGPRLQRLSSSSFAGSVHDALVSFARVPPPPHPYVPPVPRIRHSYPIKTPPGKRGRLRVYSLHLKESISVDPFDARQRPDPEAFAKINHLWRCRFTGHEAPIDPHLVRLLTTLNDIYDKPIHLISGHRTAFTVNTSPTSQHTIGTAADIRIPGVPTQTLQQVVKRLGARGVGIYAHQHFVHADFRMSRKYYWEAQPHESEHDAMQAERGAAQADKGGDEPAAEPSPGSRFPTPTESKPASASKALAETTRSG